MDEKDNAAFWQAIDQLVAECEVVIDRPAGSRHPRYAHIVYGVDYGYLAGSTAMDGGGVDVWRGTLPEGKANAVVCTVDLFKKDAEVKILLGCTPEETGWVYAFHNEHHSMKGLLISRTIL